MQADYTRLLFLYILIQPLTAQVSDVNMLFISSYPAELPWNTAIQEGLDEMSQKYRRNVVMYNEYLDNMRLIESLTVDEWIWYLSTKYKNAGIDIIPY